MATHLLGRHPWVASHLRQVFEYLEVGYEVLAVLRGKDYE